MRKVFIDESGNMGKGGRYFVLAAMVVGDEGGSWESEKRIKRLIRREQMTDLQGKWIKDKNLKREVKFAKMKFKQRQRIVTRLAGEGIDLYYFVAYKPAVYLLNGEVNATSRNLIYNYFCRLLVSRILKRYGEDVEIVFDQRTTAVKSMNSLRDYIRLSAYLDFPHLRERKIRVRQADSKSNLMLQAADVVVGAGAQAYNMQNLHFLNIFGLKIMTVDEFPRGSFVGSRKGKIRAKTGPEGPVRAAFVSAGLTSS